MDQLIEERLRHITNPSQRVGATYMPGEGVFIRLWAPAYETVKIEWIDNGLHDLMREDDGYHTRLFPAAQPDDLYIFHADGESFPDPASRSQPEGVYGPSAVVDTAYDWQDEDWKPAPYEEWVIYEIHTGTYAPSHDFQGIIDDLPRLRALGVTTIEIMPVSQFSGERNWGYDGVFPHAVQNSYGGPAALKTLVDACHAQGLAIVLDVVYNHIGPEGNVLFPCGPYTQEKYHTPWGKSLNFDGPDSDHVRRYFLQTAWQWLTEYRFDGLRLDAVQAILDTSPVPFLEELSYIKGEAEKLRGHPLQLIAETDTNDSRLLAPPEENGMGMDAHWADDLHHALHATLTGEQDGYYADYGGVEQIAGIYKNGVAYSGRYSAFRRRLHGRSYENVAPYRLISETQNHDQIGNRLRGERLSVLVDFERLKLAAACVLLSPFTPHLFMGEEYAETKPFLYFADHEDEELCAVLQKERQEEWEAFNWAIDPPPPCAPATFESCVLTDKSPPPGSRGAAMQAYYRALIHFSKLLRTQDMTVALSAPDNLITLTYAQGESLTLVHLSFHDRPVSWAAPSAHPAHSIQAAHIVLKSTLVQPGFTAFAPQAMTAGAALTLPPFSATIVTV